MENQEKKHTSDNFYDWVRHEKFAIGLALFCAFCPLLASPKWEFKCLTEADKFSFLWYLKEILDNGHHYQIINIVFIFIILFLFTRMKIVPDRSDDKVEKLHKYVKDTFGENSTLARNTPAELFDRISIGVRQFYFLWIFVWIVWLIMYIIEFIYAIVILPLHEFQQYELTIVHNLFENSLNLISSFLLFFIYMDITISTVRVGTLTDNGRNTMYIGSAILVLIGTIFFTIDIFSLFLPSDSYHLTQFFLRLFIGVIASMSMMAVLGRLNASFLKIPQPFIMCLYWYATVQMLYPLTYAEKTCHPYSELLNNVLNISAFLGKGCLILVLQWITKENRFLFFLIHKANSLSDSDSMLRRFNKYYKGCPDK